MAQEKTSPSLRALAIAGFGALLGLGLLVRMGHEHGSEIGPAAEAEPGSAADPTTGAVLIDLEDGADADDRAEIVRALVGAIAPYPWPADPSGLGTELEHEAELFRVRPPASEIDDVLRALEANPEVNAVQLASLAS